MTISATEPDWSRETCRAWWDPGPQLIKSIRRYQAWQGRGALVGAVFRRYYTLRYRFWSAVSGADIPLKTRLGGGLKLPHPNGIVIHPDAEIGPNCMIFHQVTLGTTEKGGAAPCIGGEVLIGAGAKVLGGVRIGNHARIGANAVVLNNVPDNAVAVGVPARTIKSE